MMSIPTTAKALFFPPTPEKLNFQAAVQAHRHQQLARITKMALFIIATLAASATIILTEAAIITWTIALPVIAVTIAAGLLFYRLNALDHRHIEHVEDEKKDVIVQKRLEKLFYEPTIRDDKYVRDSLRGLNRLFGKKIFTDTFIAKIVFLNNLKADGVDEKSLAQLAKEEEVNLSIRFEDEWTELGRFDLPGYQWSLKFNWDGQHGSPIEISCKRAIIVKKEAEEE